MKIFKILLIDNDEELSAKARSYLHKALDNINIVLSPGPSGSIDFQGVNRIDLAVISDCSAQGACQKTLMALRNFDPPVPVIIIFDKMCGKNMDDYLRLGIDQFVIKDNNYYSALNDAVAWGIKRLARQIEIRKPHRTAKNEPSLNHAKQNPGEDHEINNLLMTIIGNVQVLLARPEINSERLVMKLRAIEESARMIARITGEKLSVPEEHSSVT